MGEEKEKGTKFSGRRLTLEDPRVISKYNNWVKKEVKKEKIHIQAQRLRKNIKEGQKGSEEENEMEALMEKLHSIMEETERKCRKICIGKREFSPLIQSKRANIGFWQAAVKVKKGRGRAGRKLRILALVMEDKYRRDIRDVNLNQAIQMWNKAEAEQETHSRRRIEARESWKMLLSKARAKENNTTAASTKR